MNLVARKQIAVQNVKMKNAKLLVKIRVTHMRAAQMTVHTPKLVK